MGLIRGGLLFFVGALLLVSLIVGNLFLTAGLSLNHDTFKASFSDLMLNSNVVESQSVDSEFAKMQVFCGNSNVSFGRNYILNSNGNSLNISCNSVKEGKDSVLNEVFDSLADEIYYKNYDCTFLNCISDPSNVSVYVSEHARNFWMKNFYYLFIASVVLSVLILLLVQPKSGFFTLSGILILISSLPVFAIGWILSKPKEFPFSVISLVVTKANFVFFLTFILGLILIAVGLSFKFWGWGYKFYNVNKDEVPEDNIDEKFRNNLVKKVVPKKPVRPKKSRKN